MKLFDRYTKDEIDFIKTNALTMSAKDIAMKLNRSENGINYKIQCLKINRKQGQKKWTTEEIEKLKQIATKHTRFELAEIFNCTYQQMVACMKNRKINCGNNTRFTKGHVPINKGKKVPLSKMPVAFQQNVFKKGNIPHNTLKDNDVTVRKYKSGLQYKWIRISKKNWELYHRHVWRQHHGPIPENMMVSFKDGNTLNCSIENLILETPQQHMERCSIARFPPELISTIMLVNKLKRKLKSYEKQD